MTAAAIVAYTFIGMGALAALARLIIGPSLADRIVATDLMLVLLVCAAGVYSAQSGSGVYLELMVVVGVLGFLGTVTVARFIERRGA